MTSIESYIDDKKHSNLFGSVEDYRYKNTKDIVSAKYKSTISGLTVIKTPYWKYPLMFSPVVLISGIITYQKIPTHTWLVPLLITLTVAAVLLIIAIRSKQNPEITLTADKQKLVIKNGSYLWADMNNTYIMTEHGAKKNYKSLLIERRDGFINEVTIDNIGIKDSELAAIIDYYKI